MLNSYTGETAETPTNQNTIPTKTMLFMNQSGEVSVFALELVVDGIYLAVFIILINPLKLKMFPVKTEF